MRAPLALGVVFVCHLGVNRPTPLIGSDHVVVGTEDMAPGDSIATHRHPSADEVVFIERGTARVHLGNIEREAHAGAIVFIPMNTWIGFHFNGPDTTTIAFVFSSPGFEQYMRAGSVREGQKVLPLTQASIDSLGRRFAHHVVYR